MGLDVTTLLIQLGVAGGVLFVAWKLGTQVTHSVTDLVKTLVGNHLNHMSEELGEIKVGLIEVRNAIYALCERVSGASGNDDKD